MTVLAILLSAERLRLGADLSGHAYLVTDRQGQHRVAMLCRTTIRGEMYGILTTLHSGRGAHLTPADCPPALIPERAVPDAAYGRITAGQTGLVRLPRGGVCGDGYALFFAFPE